MVVFCCFCLLAKPWHLLLNAINLILLQPCVTANDQVDLRTFRRTCADKDTSLHLHVELLRKLDVCHPECFACHFDWRLGETIQSFWSHQISNDFILTCQKATRYFWTPPWAVRQICSQKETAWQLFEPSPKHRAGLVYKPHTDITWAADNPQSCLRLVCDTTPPPPWMWISRSNKWKEKEG